MTMVNSVDSAYSSINRLIAAASGRRPAPVRLSNPVMARAQQVDRQDTVEIQSRRDVGRLDVVQQAAVAEPAAASAASVPMASVQLPANVHPSSPLGRYASVASLADRGRSSDDAGRMSASAPGSLINVTA